MDQNNSPMEPEQSPITPDPAAPAPKREKRNLILSASALVCIALALVFFLIANLPAFSSFFKGFIGLLNPLLWGALIAYLCNPILSFWERTLLRKMPPSHAKRMLGIVLTYLCLILIIAIFGLVLIPSLVESVKTLISEFENYIANAVTYVNNLIGSMADSIPEGIIPENASGNPGEFLSVETIIAAVDTLISKAGGLFSGLADNIAAYASRLISGVTDVILAVFISFYLLASKELRAAQLKKALAAFCSQKVYKFVLSTSSMVNRTFGQYFSGVILDALIIGVAGFIVFSILGIPFPLMIAFIVAITNIIPVFGPFLGAIPSAFIIFITAPEKTIPFILAILIMQQIDGNIVAPRILGQSTGISSLCVISSLAIMGGLWGVFGMVVGVPVFAAIITLLNQAADSKLNKKGLPADINAYYHSSSESVDQKSAARNSFWYRISAAACRGVRFLLCYAKYVFALLKYRLHGKKKKLPPPDKQAFFAKSKPTDVASDAEAAAQQETSVTTAQDASPTDTENDACNDVTHESKEPLS